jgi:hypothetical protein
MVLDPSPVFLQGEARIFTNGKSETVMLDARELDKRLSRRGRCAHAFAHGVFDAILKTHLFNSPWEV